MMIDYATHEIPTVPDAIVYVVNQEVEKVVPIQDVPEKYRGYLVPVRDEQGNTTMIYKKTAVVETVYLDDEGNMVPLAKATGVRKRYLDEEGNIISRPMVSIKREPNPDKP